MNRMIEWFARNSVAANLLMAFLVTTGLIAAFTIRSETFPETSLDLIQIDVPYLGAAPEEVEEAVCVRIEEAIQGVEGIKQITSTASEGMGSVLVEVELGADVRRLLDDLKGRVDAIDTFPEETEKPVMRELVARTRVVALAISGDVDDFTLKAIAERVRDELSSLPEISQVEITSARPYEISIEVSEATLRRHGLTFDDVANAVRRSSLDVPGGSVRSESGEILCQGRSKIRPRWRRKTRPPGRWAECLSAVVRTGWSGVWDRPWGGLRRSGNPCAQPAPSWGGRRQGAGEAAWGRAFLLCSRR